MTLEESSPSPCCSGSRALLSDVFRDFLIKKSTICLAILATGISYEFTLVSISFKKCNYSGSKAGSAASSSVAHLGSIFKNHRHLKQLAARSFCHFCNLALTLSRGGISRRKNRARPTQTRARSELRRENMLLMLVG